MEIDPRQYAEIYDQYREILQPGIRRTGADPLDPVAATYAVNVTQFDSRTGKPLTTEVIGLNRQAILDQIITWKTQIKSIQKLIDNATLFLSDADTAPLTE
jgi:hypothetical protein